MKISLLSVFFIFSLLACCTGPAEITVRQKKNINRDWQFTFGSESDDFSKALSPSANWERIGLPHTFSLPYFRSESFYVGYGWYQKTLQIDESWLSKQVSIEFDGVFQVTEVFLNGIKVGKHRGGYTGFTVNISDAIKAGENLLAVRVNNLWDARLAPRAGEHVFSGGIYRDVYLTITNPLHVAWNGTFVTTPEVTKEKATVNVKTEVKNCGNEEKTFLLKTVIVNQNGAKIAEKTTENRIHAGELMICDQTFTDIKNPELWSLDNPYLYRVKTYIYHKDSLVDNYESTLGFRWMEWTADRGFFLNGEHLYLEGANIHQDQAGWGDAVTQAGIYRDLKLMKEAGFNLIRCSHYPQHPMVTKVCDQLGLLVIPENCVWGIGGHSEDGDWKASAYPIQQDDKAGYEASAAQTLEKLIRINRNSPSVIAWSMSNEPFFSARQVMDDMKQFLVKQVELSHQLDPTRLAMIGGAQRENIDVLGDIAGYNGDGGATRYRNPGFPNMVSEYGSCIANRPGEYTPCWGYVKDGEKPQWRSGHAIWCGFDHGSIAGDMGKMGIVDFARIPKRSWYWYRNYFRGIPPPEWPVEGTPESLKLFADKSTIQGTDATDDVHVNVQVIGTNGKHISNSPDVTLKIVSGPGEFPTGRSITFTESTRNDIQILDGHAAIAFRSYEGGVSIIEATSEGLKPARIKIKTVGEPIYEEGVTAHVTERPYTDYRLVKAKKEGRPVKVSDLRPTRTNSKHTSSPSLANDGRRWTRWVAQPDNGRVWWELDMENFYHVERVDIHFISSPDISLSIETSNNQKDWNEVAKRAYRPEMGSNIHFDVKEDTEVRFLRIVFITNNTNPTLEISQIEVFGKTN